MAAFDEYSRAKTLLLSADNFSGHYSTAKNFQEGIEGLNRAVARDPSFFEAYCQLVAAHDRLYAVAGDHTPERLAQAEAALLSITRLRSDAPQTHLARASHLYYALRDYKGALAELDCPKKLR